MHVIDSLAQTKHGYMQILAGELMKDGLQPESGNAGRRPHSEVACRLRLYEGRCKPERDHTGENGDAAT
jgi:hypothetical protein